MKIRVRKEECDKCGGSGSVFIRTNAAGIKVHPLDEDAKYYGCSDCGGDFDNDGTGRVKNTYEVVPNAVCDECHGEGKVRYMKPGFNPAHSLFGNVTDKEQEKWNRKYTTLKKCIKCDGTGEKLKKISSEPIKAGWF